MQLCREIHQRFEVTVVGGFEGVDVVAAVVAGHDDGQVIVLRQVTRALAQSVRVPPWHRHRERPR